MLLLLLPFRTTSRTVLLVVAYLVAVSYAQSCTPTYSCVAGSPMGYCHSGIGTPPAGNVSFFDSYRNMGCNDCNICTYDLCLFCDWGMNGTFYCQCSFTAIDNCCHNDSDCATNETCSSDNRCVPKICGLLSFDTPSRWVQAASAWFYNSTLLTSNNITYDVVQVSSEFNPYTSTLLYYNETFDGIDDSWEISMDFFSASNNYITGMNFFQRKIHIYGFFEKKTELPQANGFAIGAWNAAASGTPVAGLTGDTLGLHGLEAEYVALILDTYEMSVQIWTSRNSTPLAQYNFSELYSNQLLGGTMTLQYDATNNTLIGQVYFTEGILPPLSGPYQRKLIVPSGILGTQMYPFLSASTGQAAADQYVTNYSLCTPLESNFSSLVVRKFLKGKINATIVAHLTVFFSKKIDTKRHVRHQHHRVWLLRCVPQLPVGHANSQQHPGGHSGRLCRLLLGVLLPNYDRPRSSLLPLGG